MNKQAQPRPNPDEKPAKPPKPDKAGPPRPSRLGTLLTTLKHYLVLAILSGTLAFAGAVWGAMLVQRTLTGEQRELSAQQLEQWTRQREMWGDQRKLWASQTDYDLTLKRIELIERTVNLMGKSTAVIGQEKNYTRSFLTAMAKTAEDPTRAVGIISKMLRESSEGRCRIAQAHAEFISLLALNEIFFGQQTRSAVRALQEVDPWWEADSARKADLIVAMRADFLHKGPGG